MAEPKSGYTKQQTDTKQFQLTIAREFDVVKNNDIIQNNFYTHPKNKGRSLGLIEQKVILYLISRIKPDTREFEPQDFKIKEFCQMFGMPTNKAYTELKNTLDKLLGPFWLYDGEHITNARWLDKVDITPRNGNIKITMSETMRPYLLGLRSNFTEYQLFYVLRMKSKYGIMLYELLKSYAYKGELIRFDIEDLKARLDCTEYEKISHFKERVIGPALKDINTYSDIYAAAEYIKDGRQFKEIEFTIKPVENVNPDEIYMRRISTQIELENQLNMFEGEPRK